LKGKGFVIVVTSLSIVFLILNMMKFLIGFDLSSSMVYYHWIWRRI